MSLVDKFLSVLAGSGFSIGGVVAVVIVANLCQMPVLLGDAEWIVLCIGVVVGNVVFQLRYADGMR